MLIITAGDNKNHRWKRKPKKKAKTGKNKGMTQATVKVWKLKLLLCV